MQGYKAPSSKTKKSFIKQTRTAKRHERFYKNNFFLFEISYIFLAIPMLTIALASVPILMFYTFAQKFYLWPMVIVAILIVFFQLTAIQYFVKRYYLEYHNMSLGEYLRYRFDNYRNNRQNDKQKKIVEPTWYDDLDEIIDRIRKQREEQTEKIYSEVYGSITQ
jgi:hypothetical protein